MNFSYIQIYRKCSDKANFVLYFRTIWLGNTFSKNLIFSFLNKIDTYTFTSCGIFVNLNIQNTYSPSMIKIRCVVDSIIYQNQENGYSVLKAVAKGYNDPITLVGNIPEVCAGSVLLVEGDWKVDKRYGSEFVAENWEEIMPATIHGIEKYLASGLIKGIGPIFAKRIVAKFGLNTIDIIDDNIDRLNEVDGIGAKRLDLIKESWEKQRSIKNVMLFLQGHGVSTTYAAKIYKTYGKECIDKVSANPYCLADDIWGIGFKTADSIAKNMGYANEDVRRCRSGILYTLSQLSNEGHVYASQEQLIIVASKLLETKEESIRSQLSQMVRNEDIIVDGESIYLPSFYHAETGIANKLRKLMDSSNAVKGTIINMDAISSKTGVGYDTVQADAIKRAATSKVMVLTGGPGTGKTTTTEGIIAALRSLGLDILLAAPTGRAAKRMSEATNGMEAKTIHRLLEYKPDEGYQRNEYNMLDGDALIVDESSMIDIMLMYSLLKALPLHMRLILVGDTDQLPSVGAGNVLHDIIESGQVPVIRLTRIFRQAQNSRIVMNAHKINQGIFPDISNGQQTDFFFIHSEDPEQAAANIVNLVKNRLPKAYKEQINHIQVLSPMQRGVTGVVNLNMALQQALNPDGINLSRNGSDFRQGDRVMQIKNNYDKDVFNGDIGLVAEVNIEERTLSVDYDGKLVKYEASDLDEIVLAYAITIHKSQGSEYPIVVMPILMTHFVMLQRNLIYTGITRAKKVCILIGAAKALAYAVNNITVNKRNSKLKERLSF